jgi:hypothetical protein
LAKEIADLRQEKRRTKPSKESGPDAVAKHAAVLAKLDAAMTKAAIAYQQRKLEAPLVVHEIKADTAQILTASTDTNNKLIQLQSQLETDRETMRTFERVNSGAALPVRPPDQTASQRLAVVYQEIRRLQTEGKNLRPEVAAERANEYTEAADRIQTERSSLKEQKALLAEDKKMAPRAKVKRTAAASAATASDEIAPVSRAAKSAAKRAAKANGGNRH